MQNHPLFGIIKQVATATLAAEHGLNAAVTDTAKLISTTVTAQEDAKLPAGSVQSALDHLGAAMQDLISSRRRVTLAHAEYGITAERLGASPEAFGDWWPCPKFPTKSSAAEREPLRAVG